MARCRYKGYVVVNMRPLKKERNPVEQMPYMLEEYNYESSFKISKRPTFPKKLTLEEAKKAVDVIAEVENTSPKDYKIFKGKEWCKTQWYKKTPVDTKRIVHKIKGGLLLSAIGLSVVAVWFIQRRANKLEATQGIRRYF